MKWLNRLHTLFFGDGFRDLDRCGRSPDGLHNFATPHENGTTWQCEYCAVCRTGWIDPRLHGRPKP